MMVMAKANLTEEQATAYVKYAAEMTGKDPPRTVIEKTVLK